MRLFMAFDVPGEIVEKIGEVRRGLERVGADVKWVDPGQYHVTVKFLGEVEDSLVEEIGRRMERAAGEVPAFEVEVEGVDRFPEKGVARVIVSRILSPDMRLTKLHRLIDSGVGGMGLPMDTRVLVPHLTLGRVRSNRGVNKLLRLVEKHDLDFFGSFMVERVRLYRSELGEGGARHEVLREGELARPKNKTTEETESTEVGERGVKRARRGTVQGG